LLLHAKEDGGAESAAVFRRRPGGRKMCGQVRAAAGEAKRSKQQRGNEWAGEWACLYARGRGLGADGLDELRGGNRNSDGSLSAIAREEAAAAAAAAAEKRGGVAVLIPSRPHVLAGR